MAYICYKPKGSCKTCEHFRYDEDKMKMCCWAEYDEKHNVENGKRQIITSAATSVNTTRLPAVYNKINFDRYKDMEDVKLFDYGCGVEATRKLIEKFLKKYGIEYMPYDPYNMPLGEAASNYEKRTEANIIVCSNVLNVIDSDDELSKVMAELTKLSRSKDVFVTVYEGNHSGVGKQTTKGYQRNRNVSWYRGILNGYYGTLYSNYKNWKLCNNVIWSSHTISDNEIPIKY